MRVLVCGDRNWDNEKAILRELKNLEKLFGKISCLIHGDCRGADRQAGSAAEKMGIKIEKYPAEWDKYGKAAGPIRNGQMLTDGNPDVVLAFHENIGRSVGTADMVRQSKMANLTVFVFDR